MEWMEVGFFSLFFFHSLSLSPFVSQSVVGVVIVVAFVVVVVVVVESIIVEQKS